MRFALSVSILALLGHVQAPADEKEQVVFEDRFAGRLADGWSWIREDPKAWRLEEGALVERTSTGSLWMKQNNSHNLMLRQPPPLAGGRIAIEVLVDNEPTEAFEHAGLVWYDDDDNYVALMKEKVGKHVVVQLVSEKNGKPRVGFAEKPYQPRLVWLRLEVSGGKLRGLYRAPDQQAWQRLGEDDLPGTGRGRVGLITGYGPKDGSHLARFREFRIRQATK